MNRLRDRSAAAISLVAVEEGPVVGDLLFSPLIVESDETGFDGLGLAPLTVFPEYQKKGIGSMLIRQEINELRNANYTLLVSLMYSAIFLSLSCV